MIVPRIECFSALHNSMYVLLRTVGRTLSPGKTSNISAQWSLINAVHHALRAVSTNYTIAVNSHLCGR